MEPGADIFLTRREAAERYKLSESTLARLASQGRGPVYYKPIDIALYRPADVEAWILAAIVRPAERRNTPQAGGRGTARRRAPEQPSVPQPQNTVSAEKPRGRPRKNLQPSLFSTLKQDDDAVA
jgi:hypothetical protein